MIATHVCTQIVCLVLKIELRSCSETALVEKKKLLKKMNVVANSNMADSENDKLTL